MASKPSLYLQIDSIQGGVTVNGFNGSIPIASVGYVRADGDSAHPYRLLFVAQPDVSWGAIMARSLDHGEMNVATLDQVLNPRTPRNLVTLDQVIVTEYYVRNRLLGFILAARGIGGQGRHKVPEIQVAKLTDATSPFLFSE